MFAATAVAILVTMALVFIRALLGPTVYDRILAVNMFGTKTVLLLSVIAFLYGRPDFLDLALATRSSTLSGYWPCWNFSAAGQNAVLRSFSKLAIRKTAHDRTNC